MSIREGMEHKLVAALSPSHIEIVDESDLHKGHMGARPGGETHFRMTIVSSAFEGLNRVARHQKVHDVLSEELAGPVHALSLALKTPDEAAH